MTNDPLTSRRPHTRPIVELLSLAAPTVLQMASYTLMQFIDTWLLAHLGDVEASAAAMSGLLAFSVMSFGMGTLQLVNTLASQAFGRRDNLACGEHMWQGIWLGAIYSLLVWPVAVPAGELFRLMGHSTALASFEATYLRIVLITTGVKMLSTVLGQFLLAINRPRAVFLAAAVGVVANAMTAYPMVLGRWGIPKMGVAGAGWAQNVGVTVEALVLIGFVLAPGVRKVYGSLRWRPQRAKMLTLLRVGWPSGAQFIADVLAWSVFSSVVMAHAGEAAMAANIYTFRFMSVSFMPAIGIGTAITALVGRYIGMGRTDIAVHRAHLGFLVNAAYMLCCGVAFFVFREQLMRLFSDDPSVLRIGAVLLTFAAVYQFADALYCSYVGALRGAGDTFVPAVATGALNWTVSVGLGWVVIRQLPAYGAIGPWVCATVYGIILGIFMFIRFQRGAWKEIRLDERPGGFAISPSA